MRSNSGKKNSSGQFRFLPLLVICLAGVATAVDFTVIISIGPVSSLPQAWQDILKNYVVQGSAQASFYEEEEGDPGIPPDNSGTIINEVNNALNGSGTACCPTVTVDENGNAHVNIGVSGGTGGLTNQTINVTLGNVTVPIFLNNITAVAERKSKDNTVIVIALAVTLGTCSILAAAAFYYWYYRKHHGGGADKLPKSKTRDPSAPQDTPIP